MFGFGKKRREEEAELQRQYEQKVAEEGRRAPTIIAILCAAEGFDKKQIDVLWEEIKLMPVLYDHLYSGTEAWKNALEKARAAG